MKPFNRQSIIFLMIQALFIGMIGFSVTIYAAETKTMLLNFGATQSSSSYFPPRIAMGKIINKYVPEVRVTTLESGSSYDNAKQVEDGIFQIGSGGLNAPREQYWGDGKWKSKPWKKVRLFMGLSEGRLLIYVRRDSKIKSWSDLNEKPFNPGFMGSYAESLCMNFIEAIPEIKPKLVRGTLEDTMKKLRTGSVVGTMKASSTRTFDAGMASVNVEIPLDIIGLNENQKQRVQKAFPHLFFGHIKKGQYKEAPECGNFWIEASINGSWVTSDLPEDIVYKMVKAIYEHYDEVVKSFAPAGWADPLKMITEAATEAEPNAFCPLHAGVVKYCKEIGIKVPESLIPPEYK